MAIKIITTEDGSHSLFDEELNETYHSTRGALGESQHVFIKEGLTYFLDKYGVAEVSILEIGLGTGLNAFLAAIYSEEHQVETAFTSLEPFPVEKEIWKNLNYHQSEQEKDLFHTIHSTQWESLEGISAFFSLEKTATKLEHFTTSQSFNIIFFDAFAPSKQEEVWSFENIKKCFSLLNTNGILVTYCAQGQFKRDLAQAGFEVETLQGAMGKKEMVRATKVSM
ncbi:MAG: tRNA (5-methylaminomethyl-2-thiouridine)(34)-methyltransferase MnmD [Cyclobacteriaceae bacterium]